MLRSMPKSIAAWRACAYDASDDSQPPACMTSPYVRNPGRSSRDNLLACQPRQHPRRSSNHWQPSRLAAFANFVDASGGLPASA